MARAEQSIQLSNSLQHQPVLAFNLGLEHQRIHERAHRAPESEQISRARFLENAVTYARESNNVSMAAYDPYILRRDNKRAVSLYNDQWDPDIPIREAFNPDSNNPKLKWPEYRKSGINYQRAQVEYRTFCDFEQSDDLRNARDGDVFVWVSPPPLAVFEADLSPEEKNRQLQELGYRVFSHTFLFTKQGDRLDPIVIRNKLNAAGHREFLRQSGIDGEYVETLQDDLDFLGRIHKISNPAISTADDAKRTMDYLYTSTPPEERIIDPDEEQDHRAEYITDAVIQTQSLIEHLYYVLKHTNPELISHPHMRNAVTALEFRWEQEVMKIIRGEATEIHSHSSVTSHDIEMIAQAFVREQEKRIQEMTEGIPIIEEEVRYYSLPNNMRHTAMLFESVPVWQVSIAEQRSAGFAGGHCGKGGGFDTTREMGMQSSAFTGQRIFSTGSGATTYSSAIDLFSRNSSSESEWEWKTGNCRPKKDGGCGAVNVDVGPCKICRSCQRKYDAQG